MAIINRCCCWHNVRSGSFAAGFYTLILYTVILTGAAFHLDAVLDTPPMLVLSLLLLACSGCCVITSVLLLIGLCVDSRMLLLPWLISVFATTSLDILVSVYLVVEANFDTFLAFLFSFDFLVCALNVYCLLCVFSQYQEYVAGRGYPVQRNRQIPPVEYRNERCGLSNGSRMPTDSGVTNTSSVSMIQSSVHPNHEISTISQESSVQYRNAEEFIYEEKEKFYQAGNPSDTTSLLNNTSPSSKRCMNEITGSTTSIDVSCDMAEKSSPVPSQNLDEDINKDDSNLIV